jgi:hypothetical protein
VSTSGLNRTDAVHVPIVPVNRRLPTSRVEQRHQVALELGQRRTLGYSFTHILHVTNVNGSPLYGMIFATDHAASPILGCPQGAEFDRRVTRAAEDSAPVELGDSRVDHRPR